MTDRTKGGTTNKRQKRQTNVYVCVKEKYYYQSDNIDSASLTLACRFNFVDDCFKKIFESIQEGFVDTPSLGHLSTSLRLN